MDWLIQEAAKDLVNAEEEATGEEHGGERREEDSVGEEGGPALMDEDLPEEEEAGEGEEEEAGGACIEVPLPEEGIGEKRGRALETVFREVSSADTVVAEDAGAPLNGEEQGGARTEEEEEEEGIALTGEGERCLRLGLKAEEDVVRSVSRPGVTKAGLGLSIRLDVSDEGREDGRLPEGRHREPCWSDSLKLVLDRACVPSAEGKSCGLWLVNVGRRSTDCTDGGRGRGGFDSEF